MFIAAALGFSVMATSARAPQRDVAAVVKGNNQFAFELYGQLRPKDGNLFFSPNSVSTALGMTYAGARGETAAEMAKTLHFTLGQDRLHPAFATLLEQLNAGGKKRGYQLRVANALWGQKGYGFTKDFLTLAQKNYGAGLHEVDFAGATEQARKTINAWVEKQTEDKIKELIKEGMLDSLTRLVLTNAIYFKGDWASQFKKDLTREEPFQLSPAQRVGVPMMRQTHEFNYLDAGTLQILEMPYVGKELSMVVLLPKKVDGLPEVEQSLSTEKVAGWLGKLRKQEVIVSLPKFKTTSEFSLKQELASLGMKRPFAEGADFSGMNAGKEELYISEVVHKAFVDVNEEGTEAAAATGVIIKARSAPIQPVFRADHPFVFFIRDTRHDSILVLGRIVDPTK
jgi:serpin B